MTAPFEANFGYAGGYYPNQGKIGQTRPPNTLIEGSKNVWVEGPDRVRSWSGTGAFAAYGNSIMGLLGNDIYTMGTGSACLYRGGTVFWVGTGTIAYSTNQAGTVNTSFPISNGLWFSLDNNTQFQAGLITPNKPVPTTGTTTLPAANFSGPLVGTYSFKVTLIRDADNAESNGSLASITYTSDGTKTVKLALSTPSMVGQPSGPYSFGIYVSKRGFPEGPWFFLKKVATTTSSAEIGWLDGDLADFNPPIDHDPPPSGTNAATHVFALGDILVLAGCYGGGGISPSAPGKPEAFPPEFVTFLNPNERILGIRGRPADGWQYVFCRNSLHAVYLRLDDIAPIGVRAIWSETGIANPNAAAFVGGEFYGYSGKRGVLRTSAGNNSAEPDVEFAIPIESDAATWNPNNVVVGYSPDEDAVVYFHGNIAYPYKRKLGLWSPPFTLADGGATGNVTSCVTYQGKLIISIGAQMYDFSGGTSTTIPWVVRPAFQDGGSPGWYKTVTGFRSAFNGAVGAVTTNLYTNFVTSAPKDTLRTAATASMDIYSNWKKTNIKQATTFMLEQTGTGGGAFIYNAGAIGGTTRMRTS